MTLLFATSNVHKLEELRILMGNNFTLKSLADMGYYDDIAEPGLTFAENASIKSHYIYERFKIACFADDSGLEVDALNGEPGIYSARYSGSRDTEENLQLVLHKMTEVHNRRARFRCAISLIIESTEHLFEGIVSGTILLKPAGLSGFGYDPIFRPDGYSESFAEMTLALKNKISHRGKAIAEMVKFLKSINS